MPATTANAPAARVGPTRSCRTTAPNAVANSTPVSRRAEMGAAGGPRRPRGPGGEAPGAAARPPVARHRVRQGPGLLDPRLVDQRVGGDRAADAERGREVAAVHVTAEAS